MSAHHPSRELFERFAGGDLTSEERRVVVEHLLAGCPRCREIAERYWPSSLSPAPVRAPKLSDQVLARLQEREARAEREREEAEELLAAILPETPARRHVQVVNRRKFHTYAFCRRLQDQSITQIFADPHDALALAELSLAVAQLVPVDDATPGLIADLKARSWVRIANVHRVLADFANAEAGFAEARLWLARGTADPVEEADLLELEATLRGAQRRFQEAEAGLQRALRLQRRVGDTHAEGKVLVVLAITRNAAGDAHQAIELLHQALALIDPARDPRLGINARHNLAVFLANIGQPEEALRRIVELRTLYDPARDRTSLLRLRYLECRVRFALGDPTAALAGFEDVLREFVDLAMPLEVALVSLEMATIHMEIGALDTAQRLATETLSICRSLGIQREVMGALMVIEETAQRKALTRELLGEALTYLKQVRQNPGVKFRA